jgi:CRP-like cAMP-binding protein
MQVSRETFNKIVELLIPHMERSKRRSLIASAFHGYNIQHLIYDWDDSNRDFSFKLVELLLDFGEVEPKKPAITVLLDEIREQVGVDKQAQIDEVKQAIADSGVAAKRPLSGSDNSSYRTELQTISRVFPQLSAQDVQTLHQVVRIVDHPADFSLCKEGELERTFYIIIDGEAEVRKTIAGRKEVLSRKTAGDFFGEMALILNEPRTADVVTTQRTKVIEIDRTIFEQYLISHVGIVLGLTELTMKQLKRHEELLYARMTKAEEDKTKAHRVFVSHATKDKAFALKLAEDIAEQGISVWIATRDVPPGRSWPREVAKALDTCTLMLLVISEESIKSNNVEDEWNYYLDRGKNIIPVLLERCDLPFRLLRIHYIDFTSIEYTVALARLVAAIRYHD